jgi:hypothetical protein
MAEEERPIVYPFDVTVGGQKAVVQKDNMLFVVIEKPVKPDAVVARFAGVLQEKGITTITRRTRGGDIDAACGQLAGRVLDRARRQRHFLRIEEAFHVQPA